MSDNNTKFPSEEEQANQEPENRLEEGSQPESPRESQLESLTEQETPSQESFPASVAANKKARLAIKITVGVVITFLFVAVLAWAVTKSCFQTTEPPVQETAKPVESWSYPCAEVMQTLVVDDFNLCLDGSITFTTEYEAEGLSKAYLDANLVFNPEVSFRVEQVSTKQFTVWIDGGQDLKQTSVHLKSAGGKDDFYATIRPHFAVRVETEQGLNGTKIDAPIKVVFNDRVDASKIKEFISITPQADFDVSGEDNVVTLVPREMLDYQTEYTVTVLNAFQSERGFSLPVDSNLGFVTEMRDHTLVMTNSLRHSIAPQDDFKLEYQLETRQKQGRDTTVELYALSGFDQYYALLANPQKEIDETQFRRIGETQEIHMKDGVNTVEFKNPGFGHYVVKTSTTDTKTGGEVASYQPIQVVTQMLYFQAVKTQSLLWLNDTLTGQALTGYRLVFERDGVQLGAAQTGSDGTAIMEYKLPEPPEGIDEDHRIMEEYENKPVLFKIYNTEGVPVYADTTVSLTRNRYYGGKLQDRYYSYVYFDRALYRPTDTIQFWGYVKPYMMNRSPMPSAVTVTLDEDGINQQVQVNILPDGTFHGQLSYKQAVSGEYSIRVEIPLASQDIYTDDYTNQQVTTHSLVTEWIEIKEFQKPAYKIESRVDKVLYERGEEVKVTVAPTFYDGTPLPDYPLELSVFNPYSGNFEQTQKLTTDAKGIATAVLKAGEGISRESLTWMPKTGYYYVKIASDGENITYRGSYDYLPGNVMIQPALEFNEDESDAKLTVQAYNMTAERVTTEAQMETLRSYGSGMDDPRYDILKGAPVDIRLTADVSCWYAEPIDQLYRSQDKSYTMDINAGKGSLERLIDFEFDKEFNVRIRADVAYTYQGNKIESGDVYQSSSCSRRGKSGADNEKGPTGYYFNVYRNGGVTPVQDWEEYLLRGYLDAGVGDELRFELCRDGMPVTPAQGGRMIYTLMQDEIIGRGNAVNSFTLTQKPAYANSVLVVAAYFDGHTVHAVQNCYVSMDQESMKLDIKTQVDKSSYRPGEEVTLQAKVTDANGNPVQARMCIGVVDESVFALREQYVNVLDDLYGEMNFYNYFIYKYTTATGDIDPFSNGGDGGKGDGNNIGAYDVFRKNFKDTALFYPTTSDAQGNVSVRFKLPDNITSWRVTTVAVGTNMYAGNSKTNFIATLPFFAKPVLSSKYIVGDEVAMLIQGHGVALKEDSRMNYTVHIQGDGVDETYNEQGKAYEAVTINFGKLAEGEYTVTSTAQLGDMRDTVELPIAVVSSNLEMVVTRELNLNEPIDLNALRYPVVITMYDEEYQAYYESISSLLTHYCFRADQRMSRFAAKRALMKHCDSENIPQYIRVGNDSASDMQNPDGGIGWYMGAESDPELTMKILLFAGDQFNLQRMKTYLVTVAEDSAQKPLARAAAHAGIAAIDGMHTEKIKLLLSENKDIPLQERLYYMVGLAYGGDTAGAKAIYDEYVVPLMKHHGEELWLEYSKAPQLYERTRENEQATAAAWIVASKLRMPDADAYALYFGRSNWRISSLFECMIYVTNFSRDVPAPPTFTYIAGGERHTVDLGVSGRQSVTLNRSQMEGLKFENVPERVIALAYYIGEPSETEIKPSDTVSIEKTIEPLENGRHQNTITIRFKPEASYGYYNISDWIPSNMRLYNIGKYTGGSWVGDTQEGQKLYFEFYRNEHSPETMTLTYQTQKTYDVEAVIDRTYLVCADSGENAFSERSTIQ